MGMFKEKKLVKGGYDRMTLFQLAFKPSNKFI